MHINPRDGNIHDYDPQRRKLCPACKSRFDHDLRVAMSTAGSHHWSPGPGNRELVAWSEFIRGKEPRADRTPRR